MSSLASRPGAGAGAPFRAPVYVACSLIAIALSYLFGKEMAWDTLHYHLYAGFSAVNDRFEYDYFAAGPQAYFNPYAYAPFFVLVKLGLPGLAIGTILAIVHSVVLWLTYELACKVCPSYDRRERLIFGLCATAFAFLNPILLQQLGSSFADITTAAIVLWGYLHVVNAIQRPAVRSVIYAGVILGIASALKPTNALHAVAALIALAFARQAPAKLIRSLFYFCICLAVGFALAAAPWSYRLAKSFGNPMFPLLNEVFRSPEFTTAPLKHYRFVPDSLNDALLRPFTMMDAAPMIHEELSAPDFRYALLSFVILISILIWVFRSRRPASFGTAAPEAALPNRTLMALGCAFLFDWFIWLHSSGNSRYFTPMSSVAAVLITALFFRLLANHKRGRAWLLITLLVAQSAQLCLSAQLRWDSAPWSGQWFNVELPPRLAKEPNLYLSLGMQSNSFIIPYMGQGSGIVNFSGAYSLGPDGANAAHVRAMIQRNEPHVRVLVSGESIFPNSARREPRQSDIDDELLAFGLRVDMTDCDTITIRGMRPRVQRSLESSIPGRLVAPGARYTSHLATCHVVPDYLDQTQELAERRAVDIVLDRLEDACPILFQPPRPQSEHQNQLWLRAYSGTDLTMWVDKGEIKFTDPTRGSRDVVLGREIDWAKSPQGIECGRRHGVYFARPVRIQ
jgi:hypothetical protein